MLFIVFSSTINLYIFCLSCTVAYRIQPAKPDRCIFGDARSSFAGFLKSSELQLVVGIEFFVLNKSLSASRFRCPYWCPFTINFRKFPVMMINATK
jgi:hypothetical protein